MRRLSTRGYVLENKAGILLEPLVVNGSSVAEVVGLGPETELEEDGVPVELELVE